MDYEKAYKNLVAKVKNAHLYAQTDSTKNVLEDILPELRESEDEKIRKELLEEIEFIIPHDDETDSEGLILPSYHARIDRYKSYLEKQKEQPIELLEPDKNVEKIIEDVIRIYGKTQGEWVGGYDIDTLIVNLRRAFKQKEQKPAEWSEEDEATLGLIQDAVDKYDFDNIQTYYAVSDKLKSLRPQPHWKPSEEQMLALGGVLDYLEESDNEDADIIRELINNLKKL